MPSARAASQRFCTAQQALARTASGWLVVPRMASPRERRSTATQTLSDASRIPPDDWPDTAPAGPRGTAPPRPPGSGGSSRGSGRAAPRRARSRSPTAARSPRWAPRCAAPRMRRRTGSSIGRPGSKWRTSRRSAITSYTARRALSPKTATASGTRYGRSWLRGTERTYHAGGIAGIPRSRRPLFPALLAPPLLAVQAPGILAPARNIGAAPNACCALGVLRSPLHALAAAM